MQEDVLCLLTLQEKVENDLQNIEEKSKFHTSFDNSLSVISLNNSQAEERSMVTAAISGFDSVFESQSKLPSEFDCTMPWKETSRPTYCSKADSTDTKAALNKHLDDNLKNELVTLKNRSIGFSIRA